MSALDKRRRAAVSLGAWLIAGAGIDVTEEEPLAPNSPSWEMEQDDQQQ